MNNEESWIIEQRTKLIDYAKRNIIEYEQIGEWPAFHVAPYFAIWAIESSSRPGYVGFWAFTGDIPTDVVKRDWSRPDDNPRLALSRILDIWPLYISHLKNGSSPPGITIGTDSETRMELANILNGRISLLTEWKDDDDIWPDDCTL